MKNYLVLLLILVMSSCSLDSDESVNNYQELLPVESVVLPEVFIMNDIYNITLTYLRPTNCHAFNDIYYVKHNNERTVAIISTYFASNGNCTIIEENEINAELEATFEFQAIETGSYIFKFWQGENENGEDQYLIIEVPVVE